MFKSCLSHLSLIQKHRLLFTGAYRNFSTLSDSTIKFEIFKPERKNESSTQLKARLLYQSRKRGMLENDLLLSTFAHKHLHSFNPEQLAQYDKLINDPSNDWDLYYWLTGKAEPPAEFQSEVFDLLKDHTQNKNREVRCRQPPISLS